MMKSIIQAGKKSRKNLKKRSSTSVIPTPLQFGENDRSKLSASISCPSTLYSPITLPSITVVDLISANKYQITFLQQIGDGSSGKVFIASKFHSDEPIGGIFAVKVFTKEQHIAFSREQSSLQKLHHPVVPSLLFSATLPTSEIMLAMDLGCGGSLLSLILDRGSLNEFEARPILYQVFAAVAHAHSCQIVHRDIKLENVIFKDYSQTSVFLIDWGLSTTFSPSTFLQEDCGSLHNAAPELLEQKHYIGPEIDAWSLGVLIYTTVVGNFPFPGSTVEEKLESISQPPIFPPTLSREIVSLILSLLRVDTTTRMLPTEALNHEWFASLPFQPLDNQKLQAQSSRRIGPSKFYENLSDFTKEHSHNR